MCAAASLFVFRNMPLQVMEALAKIQAGEKFDAVSRLNQP
jgi:hypothetical protein